MERINVSINVTKKSFHFFIDHLNENKIPFQKHNRHNIKQLIKCWNIKDDVAGDFFMQIMDYHKQIMTDIDDIDTANAWNKYMYLFNDLLNYINDFEQKLKNE